MVHIYEVSIKSYRDWKHTHTHTHTHIYIYIYIYIYIERERESERRQAWMVNTKSRVVHIYEKEWLLTVLSLWLKVSCGKSKCCYNPHSNILTKKRRCPWCSRYRRRNWTRRHEFKSWTRLIAFHIALIPLGKVWIQLFSLQLWVNSRTD